MMQKDIQSAIEIGADGIVIGCLKQDGTVDLDLCSRLIEAAKGLPVTFHRAFDVTPDPFEALETIKSLGVKRILTSGQKNRAEEGIELIRNLQEMAGTKLRIMAGSGIDESNIQKIATNTGVSSFHASLREDAGTKNFKITNAQRVKALIKKIEEL